MPTSGQHQLWDSLRYTANHARTRPHPPMGWQPQKMAGLKVNQTSMLTFLSPTTTEWPTQSM